MSNETFNIWHGSAKSPSWNMAADEFLLRQSAIVGQAVLRLYSWNQPSSSFGYFQRYAEVSLWTDLRPLADKSVFVTKVSPETCLELL